MHKNFSHIPVLLHETISAILPNAPLLEVLTQQKLNQIYIVDATLGGGGHASHLIEEFHKTPAYKKFFLHFIGIDQDMTAIQAATQKLENLKTTYHRFKYSIFHANFDELSDILKGLEADTSNIDETTKQGNFKIHALYADFGVSSPQLDTQERGFSFLHEGPLDMRMNQKNHLTAEKILLSYSESDLARIFFEYGEEPKSRLLARAIVADRKQSTLPITNTKVFAEYVKKILKYGYSRVHPATRVFQALRIEVNSELDSIQSLLSIVPNIMCDGRETEGSSGKVTVGFISFHSLEDRLVKKTMRLWQMKEMGRENPRGGIVPTPEEIAHNPRARSARLRVFDFTR